MPGMDGLPHHMSDETPRPDDKPHSKAAEAFKEKLTRTAEAEEKVEPGFYWAKWYGSGPWIPVKVAEHWNGERVGFWVTQLGSANVCRADQYTFGERIKEPE